MGWLNNNACVYSVSHAICLLNSFQQFGHSSHITGLSTNYTFYPKLSVHKTMLQYLIMASTCTLLWIQDMENQ